MHLTPVSIPSTSSVPGIEPMLRTVCCTGLRATGKPLQWGGVGFGSLELSLSVPWSPLWLPPMLPC